MAQNQLASFSSLILFLATAVAFASQADAADLCGKADYVPLCRSIVKGGTDPRVALKGAIEHLIMETKRAKESSGRLGKSQYIGVCKTNLSSAVDSLQDSIQSLKMNDKSSLNTYLSAAISFYSSCDDAVMEGGTGIVKLATGVLKTDTILMHIASTCLYLSSLF